MTENNQEMEPVDFEDFLETIPPGNEYPIMKFQGQLYGNGNFDPLHPVLELYCDSESCNDIHFYDYEKELKSCQFGNVYRIFLTYVCRHCKATRKHYAILGYYDEESKYHMLQKLGEYPSFGPITPNRVFKIVGPDRDMYLKGRRSEALGLGIASFAYYRRVVENQKNRMIDQIIGVLKIIRSDKGTIEKFENAKLEQRFSASVEIVKGLVPDILKIQGHNPLTLLHSALSEGVHNMSDAECLEQAQSIRVVLLEFSERIEAAVKDSAEIKGAISSLLKKKQTQTSGNQE